MFRRQEKVKAIIKEVDEDKDGKINFEEVRHIDVYSALSNTA